MEKHSISTSLTPEVLIEQVQGSLTVKGQDDPVVELRANQGSYSIEEGDDVIHLSCQESCDLKVPKGTTLKVGSVNGSARFRGLEDELQIDKVQGSTSLRNVAAVRIERVSGELAARYLSGDFYVGQVAGNASVRGIQGNCTLDKVVGNVDLRNVEGDIGVEAGGNVRLRLDMILGTNYQVEAGGNLNARIPEGSNLKLFLSSRARNIKFRLPEGAQAIPEEKHELTLGSGEVEMVLSSGGNLYLVSEGGWDQEEMDGFDYLGADFSNELSQQIAQQIEMQILSQVENMTQQINDQVIKMAEQVGGAGLSPEETEHLMEQARIASTLETERAQEKMRKASEKLERRLEAARHKQELKARAAQRRSRVHGKRSRRHEPPTPSARDEPVSEEERLMILSMLEQQKISLEEAEQLLTALEGKEG